jgi:adenylate cyclase
MNADGRSDPRAAGGAEMDAAEFARLLSKARHDVHNSLGHILGFSEMLLEDFGDQSGEELRAGLGMLNRTAREAMGRLRQALDASRIASGLCDLPMLCNVCEMCNQMADCADGLAGSQKGSEELLHRADLVRIAGAARQTIDSTRHAMALLSQPVASRFASAPAYDTSFMLSAATPFPPPLEPKAGAILVVDDLEENRELLLRRLARLGYEVQAAGSGEQALEWVAANPVDLILLDIFMPGLNGIEVLQRLKSNPAWLHIPVIMLSSAGFVDTVARCIALGADDFLPKPFNATLLTARIESSLAKKRLRDQETTFLQRLQTEQETSERLLLNILPKSVAGRLKKGETNIADSFAEATVLFSDFVGFTRWASDMTPRSLVRDLNEIFSAFDRLCLEHGLEKIKMIGDAFMAVAGVPVARPDHAQAAADLALAMQREVAQFTTSNQQSFSMRIGISTGPVVAGVIGTSKFAYDLWGDTVNVASRMERHAPPGGVLVTASSYERLRDAYTFEACRVIGVEGKGEVRSYLLCGKRS